MNGLAMWRPNLRSLTWKQLLVGLVIFAAFVVLRSGTAHAQVCAPTDFVPAINSPCMPADAKVFVAERGAGIPIDASPSYIQIVWKVGALATHDVVINNGCWGGPGDTGGACNGTNGVNDTTYAFFAMAANGNPTGAPCIVSGDTMALVAGSGDYAVQLESQCAAQGIAINSSTMQPLLGKDKLYQGVMLFVNMSGTTAPIGRENAFTVRAWGPTGLAGFVNTYSDSNFPGGRNAPAAMAEFPLRSGGNGDFDFGAGAPCDFNPATFGSIYLRWQDADLAPNGNPQDTGVGFTLTQYRRVGGGFWQNISSLTINAGSQGGGGVTYLGGDGDFRQVEFRPVGGTYRALISGQSYGGSTIPAFTDNDITNSITGGGSLTFQPGDRFEWDWTNVDTNNGVQFWAPFDTINAVIDCNKGATGNFESATCMALTGWAADPDWTGSINVDIYVNGPFGAGGTFVGRYVANQPRPDVNAFLGIGGNHGFSIPYFNNGNIDNGATNAYNLAPHSVYVYAIGTDGSGNLDGNNVLLSNSGASVGPCEQASCVINSFNGGAPVIAGTQVPVTVTMTNPAGAGPWDPGSAQGAFRVGSTQPPAYLGGYMNWVPFIANPSGVISGAASEPRVLLPGVVNPGTSVVLNFKITAPPAVNAGTPFYLRMVREGRDWFGAPCSPAGGGSIPVNDEFKFEPNALTPTPNDNEDPASVFLGGQFLAPPNSFIRPTTLTVQNITLKLTSVYVPAGTTNTAQNLTGSPNTVTRNIAIADLGPNIITQTINSFAGITFKAGDRLCSTLNVSPYQGVVTAAGVVIPGNTSFANTNVGPGSTKTSIWRCFTIINKPYMKFYGSDVLAGSGFLSGLGCAITNANASFYGFAKPGTAPYYRGASVQMASMALGTIDQFYSASQRGAVPTANNGLTLANTGAGYGGSYGETDICMPDYFNTTKIGTPTTVGAAVNANALPGAGDANYQYSATGPVTLTGANNFAGRATLYVTGNVFIQSAPRYKASYAAANDIPYFTIIATGNIYINAGVSQMDGLYISQGGKIYTCATGFAALPDDQLYSTCNTPLKVNGAFIANSVRFTRSAGSLRSSPTTPEVNTSANIAETFIYSPELFIGKPALNPIRDKDFGKYDYLTSLPPIF